MVETGTPKGSGQERSRRGTRNETKRDAAKLGHNANEGDARAMKEAAEIGRLLLWCQKVNFLEVVAFEVLVFVEAFVEAFVDFFEEDCVVAAGAALEA